jgi:hypothetical protein
MGKRKTKEKKGLKKPNYGVCPTAQIGLGMQATFISYLMDKSPESITLARRRTEELQ